MEQLPDGPIRVHAVEPIRDGHRTVSIEGCAMEARATDRSIRFGRPV